MIKRNQVYLNRLNALADFCLVFVSYLFSSWFRLYVLHGERENMALTGKMMFASLLYAAGLLVILELMGFYRATRTRILSWKLQAVFLSVTASTLIASTLLYIFRLEHFSRGVLLIFYLVTLILLSGKQIIARRVFNCLRSKGYNIKHEIVVGSGKLARQYEQDVLSEPGLGIQIDAILDPLNNRLDTYLASSDIDEVVIALELEEYQEIIHMIAACEKNGARYLVIPFYNDLIPEHPVLEHVGRSKLLNMRANRLQEIGWAACKRGFDIMASGLGLVLLSPLLLVLAVGVKVSSPGPILFRQVRLGYNRREFQMLKFRSMKINNQETTAWSGVRDNRRTKFGSFIRKTSLDELPQLINVLLGDMSLVGPRPELPYFVEQFKETIPFYMVKHQVKPGITGWAQVNGYRGDTSITKRIELDLWYIENWSLLLDLQILIKTLTGAMINDEEL